MKAIVAKPPKLTTREGFQLNRCIWMKDWHFDETIKRKCTQLSSHIIVWRDKITEMKYAYVYGLQAVLVESKEPCIASIFIRFGWKVFQTDNILGASELIGLLKKQAAYEEYMDKLDEIAYKKAQRQKRLRAISKKAKAA